ncbi:MAG: hypothetical protein ACREIF_16705 [Chthoniobacterales bacterium]
MASLTIPNQWGKEGFNVIRMAIMDYCKLARTPVDLGYAFQWDKSVMLIDDGEHTLPEAAYKNCEVALANIYHYLTQWSDPWKAVAQAKAEWEQEFAKSEEVMTRLMNECEHRG